MCSFLVKALKGASNVHNFAAPNKKGTFMKPKKLLFLMALFAAMSMYADPGNDSIILNPIPTTPQEGDNPRSPILVPVLYLDGYTLTASDNTISSTIQLLDENDNVVFSTYVYMEGDINLPATLSGTYTIRVIRDGHIFEGEIVL